jgi:outer membrane lipopolysaccharide assembly protein LptE/RlpB
MRRLIAILLAVSVLGLSSACGYGTGGRAARIPPEIRTIAIPTFVNQTQTYKVEQSVTSAIVKEFHSRTKFRVLHEEVTEADAVLRGTIASTQLAPLTYDSQTGRASSALVTVNLRVSLTDRTGKILFDNPNYTFREQYQVSRDISSFFEEESLALERLSRDLARTLVADLLENY